MTDYAAERAGFAWSPPERFNFARDVLDRHAETRPDALAILWVDDHGNEAAPESMDLKRSIFSEVDANAPPHAILASNTSSPCSGATSNGGNC